MSFLIGEYAWRKQIEQKKRIRYRPTKEEVINDASKWLEELFSGKMYDYESLGICKVFPDLINDFIRYEIFADSGIVKIIFPRGMSDKERTKYKFVVAAFLFHRHYDRNEINLPEGENLNEHIINFFYAMFEEFSEYRAYTYIQFDDKCYRKEYNDIEHLTECVLKTLKKTSFVFIKPNKSCQSLVYNFPEYQEGNHQCVQLKLQITNYRDYELKNYSDYMNYLLTLERNGIANFSSSLLFWQNHVGIKRKNISLANCAEPNKVLLIFSLTLGMDNLVYERLIDLRGERTVNRDFPKIGREEEQYLYNMLKDAHWFFENARRQVNNPIEIPQCILTNANEVLIKEGLHSIIN